MMISSHPKRANVVRTHDRLRRFADSFVDGHYRFLLIVGEPGTGKTRTVQSAVTDHNALLDNHVTAFGLYCKAYERQDRPIIIDDIDRLYSDPASVRLLKALGNSEPIRTLRWQSDAKKLESEGIPKQFQTTSPVLLIANQWKTVNVNVAALESRAKTLVFQPSAREVHQYARTFIGDPDVLGFFERLLPVLGERNDVREYTRTLDDKAAGWPDWREQAMERMGIDDRLLKAAELQEQSFSSEEARVEQFVQDTGCSRATYFRVKRQLSEHQRSEEAVGQ